eukprot:UN03526
MQSPILPPQHMKKQSSTSSLKEQPPLHFQVYGDAFITTSKHKRKRTPSYSNYNKRMKFNDPLLSPNGFNPDAIYGLYGTPSGSERDDVYSRQYGDFFGDNSLGKRKSTQKRKTVKTKSKRSTTGK